MVSNNVDVNEDDQNELKRLLSPQPFEILELKIDISEFNMPNDSEVYIKLVENEKNDKESEKQKIEDKKCGFRSISDVIYEFESNQEFKVQIFEASNNTLIGTAEFILEDLQNSDDQKLVKDIEDSTYGDDGKLTIVSTKMEEDAYKTKISFDIKLKPKDSFFKNNNLDPRNDQLYVEIH